MKSGQSVRNFCPILQLKYNLFTSFTLRLGFKCLLLMRPHLHSHTLSIWVKKKKKRKKSDFSSLFLVTLHTNICVARMLRRSEFKHYQLECDCSLPILSITHEHISRGNHFPLQRSKKANTSPSQIQCQPTLKTLGMRLCVKSTLLQLVPTLSNQREHTARKRPFWNHVTKETQIHDILKKHISVQFKLLIYNTDYLQCQILKE